jgi:hypothetical protein
MSEPMWSSAVIAVLVYGCLPPLGIGVIWSLSVWISSRLDRAAAAAQLAAPSNPHLGAGHQTRALKVATRL